MNTYVQSAITGFHCCKVCIRLKKTLNAPNAFQKKLRRLSPLFVVRQGPAVRHRRLLQVSGVAVAEAFLAADRSVSPKDKQKFSAPQFLSAAALIFYGSVVLWHSCTISSF